MSVVEQGSHTIFDTETALVPPSAAKEREKDLFFKDACFDEFGAQQRRVVATKFDIGYVNGTVV